MMRTLVFLVFALLAASPIFAQAIDITDPSTKRLAWDHAKPTDVTRFEVRLDQGAWTDAGKTACPSPNAASFCGALPAMTHGAHSLTVRAVNAAGASAPSNAVDVNVIVVPSAPVTARLID